MPLPDTTQPKSLFDRLGGTPVLTGVVEKLYELILADEELSPFFDEARLLRLKKRQVLFFTQALGGPARYKGRDMKTAHQEFSIKEEHFQRVAGHLSASLQAMGIAQGIIEEVLAAVAPLQAEIVKTPDGPTSSENQRTRTDEHCS